jgi:hypothetical protein
MPKPPGTYLAGVQKTKIQEQARTGISTVASAKAEEKVKFYERLDRISEANLRKYQKWMPDIIRAIEKGECISPEDKRRKALSDAIREITNSLKEVKHFREIEAKLEQPARTVIRASTTLPGGDLLALAICVTQIVEIFLRLKRGPRPR